MYKILCLSCNKIITFEKGGISECGSCGVYIKTEIFDNDNKAKNGLYNDDNAALFYCGDEIIKAKIIDKNEQKKLNSIQIENNKVLTENGVDGIKSDCKTIKLDKKPQNGYEIKNEKSAQVAVDIIGKEKDINTDFIQQYIGDINGKHEVLPAEVECDGEIISEHQLRAEYTREKKRVKSIAKGKYKKKYYIGVSVVATVCVALVALMLYIPDYNGINGARLVGMFIAEYGSTAQRVCGAMMILCSVLSAVLFIVSAAMWGEYNKSSLGKICLIAVPLTIASATACALWIGNALINKESALSAISLCAILLCAACCVLIYFRLSFSKKKTIFASPKITEKKAYIMLGIACFFAYDIVFSVLISQGAAIASAIVKDGAFAEISNKLANGVSGLITLSLGEIETSSQLAGYASYASIALGVCLIVFVIMYSIYIARTKDIFCGKLKYDKATGKLEDDVDSKLRTRALQHSTSPLFGVYAAVFTVEIARNILLYFGSGNTGAAVFCMLASAGVLAVRCFPYAHFARETYMQAYYEYRYMGTEVAPMSKKQKNMAYLIPLPIALIVNAAFIIGVCV